MAAKRWRLIVTELGESTPLSEVAVEATNWMAALSAGRSRLGEAAGVPPGASCAVAPNGDVTVHDPRAHRTYVLTQGEGPVTAAVPAPPPPAPATPPADIPPARPKKNRAMSRTMAYIPTEPIAAPPQAAPPPPKSPKQTMAYIPGAEGMPPMPPAPPAVRPPAPPAAARPAAPAAPPAPPPPVPAPAPSRKAEPVTAVLLSSRAEEPSEESPLHFRERVYRLSEGADTEEAERLLEARLAEIQHELRELPTGKFVVLVAYDAVQSEEPDRPPLVTLQWKDWKNEVLLESPLQAVEGGSSLVPPEPLEVGVIPSPQVRGPLVTEACQDLLFLETPEQGLEFALRLFAEVLPTGAANASRYEGRTGQFHVVSASGAGAHGRKHHHFGAGQGLVAIACQAGGQPLIVADLESDPRFRPEAEALGHVTASSAIYVPLHHHGQLLGLLQLFDRADGAPFDEKDVRVAAYVGEHLSAFIHRALSL